MSKQSKYFSKLCKFPNLLRYVFGPRAVCVSFSFSCCDFKAQKVAHRSSVICQRQTSSCSAARPRGWMYSLRGSVWICFSEPIDVHLCQTTRRTALYCVTQGYAVHPAAPFTLRLSESRRTKPKGSCSQKAQVMCVFTHTDATVVLVIVPGLCAFW